MIGASAKMLGRLTLFESGICGCIGGLAGTGAAAVGALSFSALIESSLGLPYLLPDIGTILLLAAGTVLLTAAVSALASAFAAWRLSRIHPGTALREGN